MAYTNIKELGLEVFPSDLQVLTLNLTRNQGSVSGLVVIAFHLIFVAALEVVVIVVFSCSDSSGRNGSSSG